ncbi:hypothetical protein PsAD2_03393 [Pseudovibrio axinellae]|uniref:DUF1330 domain-containing protein n=1 Tax=Pseudovibrio axinellae TaxID=989403 RepID=A0A165WPX2_9HYPH|nr:DUF1330 domain-containing protein [Pseudovibrio axinellae]KZL16776.1 hypothetical protein PsAD2_03393 [Pseudovibrio axinellae]SEQ75082.1 Uncharacterized conserved protein, DUF1330 family [Pseudovibrio axinellae]
MNTIDLDIANRVECILETWGTTGNGMPSEKTWQIIAGTSQDQRLTLVNFFKFRDRAAYPASYTEGDTDISGEEAFQRYAKISMPSLEQVGGRFLMVAPFCKTFIGADQDWDLVAIGSYPSQTALLALFELEEYRKAYVHRVAACAEQTVSLCLG